MTIPELPSDIVNYIFELKKLAELDAIKEWRSQIVSEIDVDYFFSAGILLHSDMPPGFRINANENQEICGWYWHNESEFMSEPFMGADAIVSFVLKKAQWELNEEEEEREKELPLRGM